MIGSSATVVPTSALSRRAGPFVLVLAASAVFGAGNTAVILARYAVADLSTPAQRGRAIGLVVFATTFGALAGPNLLERRGRATRSAGGDSCLLAKEQSRRAAWRSPSLLSWTKRSSRASIRNVHSVDELREAWRWSRLILVGSRAWR